MMDGGGEADGLHRIACMIATTNTKGSPLKEARLIEAQGPGRDLVCGINRFDVSIDVRSLQS
jgi:hypothetical protein